MLIEYLWCNVESICAYRPCKVNIALKTNLCALLASVAALNCHAVSVLMLVLSSLF